MRKKSYLCTRIKPTTLMDILSQIALTFTAGLGNTAIRKLIDIYPNEDIFSLPPSELKAAFGSHKNVIENIRNKNAFARAEEELRFCEKNHIRPLFFTNPDYPTRLNTPETDDCPALLYCLGTTNLNPERSIAVVGTRRATAIGRDNTDILVRELKSYSPHIISGLAYGIDSAAHCSTQSRAAHGGRARTWPRPHLSRIKSPAGQKNSRKRRSPRHRIPVRHRHKPAAFPCPQPHHRCHG